MKKKLCQIVFVCLKKLRQAVMVQETRFHGKKILKLEKLKFSDQVRFLLLLTSSFLQVWVV